MPAPVLALLLVAAAAAGAAAAGEPDQLVPAFPSLSQFTTNLIEVAQHPSENRVYVVEQDGVVHTFENRDDVTQEEVQTFVDLELKEGFEDGLLGFALSPNFPASNDGEGAVYVNYVRAENGTEYTFVSRFTATARAMDKSSERVLLKVAQPTGSRNGGWLGFRPDDSAGRTLYVALGDGGAQATSQDAGSMLGKVLEVDTAFGGGTVFASGVRNPWGCSFDTRAGPLGHDLWCADVGDESREEINVMVRAGNYGWPQWEGTCGPQNDTSIEPRRCGDDAPDASGVRAPLFEYPRTEEEATVDGVFGMSVTGGVVYRGSNPVMAGSYYFADYLTLRVLRLSPEDPAAAALDTSWTPELRASSPLPVSGVSQDGRGRVLVLGSGFGGGSQVYCVADAAGSCRANESDSNNALVITLAVAAGAFAIAGLYILCGRRAEAASSKPGMHRVSSKAAGADQA